MQSLAISGSDDGDRLSYVWLQLSRLLGSLGGARGARGRRELAETGAPSLVPGRGLGEGFFAREYVPGGDRDLARDRRLGGVRFAVLVVGVGVEAVPGAGGPVGLLGGFDGGPAQRGGPGLGDVAGAGADPGLGDPGVRPG